MDVQEPFFLRVLSTVQKLVGKVSLLSVRILKEISFVHLDFIRFFVFNQKYSKTAMLWNIIRI